jgi:hypothetical protein
MPAPRIAPIDPPYPPDTQAEFDKLMRGAPPLLLFRTVARNPRVLQRMIAGGLLDRGSISLRSRELMISRTCARCGAEYEWGVHIATFGAKAQWTSAQIRSMVHGGADDTCWSIEDRLVIRLADQLHDTNRADDTREEMSAHLRRPVGGIDHAGGAVSRGVIHGLRYRCSTRGVRAKVSECRLTGT